MTSPVETTITCGGGPHRLRWDGDGLDALDHPDVEGERALVALGGTRPECLEVLAAWHAHSDDVRVLTLGPRHDGDRPVIDAGTVEAVRAGQFANHLTSSRQVRSRMPGHVRAQAFPGQNIEEQEEHLGRHLELLRLFTLPVPLQRRLCAAVAAVWLERDPNCPALYAALVGRARPALRRWAGGRVAVQFTIGPHAGVRRTDDGSVTAELPPRWLVDVWGRDLALVDGHFVLDVVEPDRVRAVAADGTVVTVSVPG